MNEFALKLTNIFNEYELIRILYDYYNIRLYIGNHINMCEIDLYNKILKNILIKDVLNVYKICDSYVLVTFTDIILTDQNFMEINRYFEW